MILASMYTVMKVNIIATTLVVLVGTTVINGKKCFVGESSKNVRNEWHWTLTPEDPCRCTSLNREGWNTKASLLTDDINEIRRFLKVTCKPPDAEAPTFISCPANQTILEDSPGESTAIVHWSNPVATDYSGDNTTVTCNAEPGSKFEIGRTDVMCEARDTSGNEATCEFTVTVISDINECASNPCENDGTCVDGRGVFTCMCVGCYVGKTCKNESSRLSVGSPITSRNRLDSGGWTLVKEEQIGCSGMVVQWRYWAKSAHSFKAVIWRSVPNSTINVKNVVGITNIPPGELNKIVVYVVPKEERFAVKAGDLVGWSFGNGVLSYNKGGSKEVRWIGGYLWNELAKDQIITFARFEPREYSIEATICCLA